MAISIFLIFYFIKLQKTAEPVWGDLWWPFFYEMENEKNHRAIANEDEISPTQSLLYVSRISRPKEL